MSFLDQLGRRPRMALRILGYIALALVVFVFALQATFPYDRVKDKIVEALSAKYDTKIGSIERGIIPGRITLHDITLRTRPAKADDAPTIFFVKSLEIHVGLFALISQTAKVHIDAAIGSGTIQGTVAISKSMTSVHVTGSKLPSNLLPMKEVIFLPMSGLVAIAVDLDLPNEKQKGAVKATPNWQKAVGSFAFRCPGSCTVGDGKTKLKLALANARSAAYMGDGTEFGTVVIDQLAIRLDIKAGVARLAEMDVKTQDGTVLAELEAQLAPTLGEADITGCIRFGGSEALLKRNEKLFQTLPAIGGAYGPDKLYHVKLDGKFSVLRKRGTLCGPGISDKSMDDPTGVTVSPSGSRGGRPNLQLQSDTPLPGVPGTGPDAALNATEAMAGGAMPMNPPPPVQVDAGAPEPKRLDASGPGPTPGPEGEVNIKSGYAPQGIQPVEQPPPLPQQPNGMDTPQPNNGEPPPPPPAPPGEPPPPPPSPEPRVR